MNSQPVTVNRSLVGAIALGLLAIAGLMWLLGLEGSQDIWRGACMKVGLVMGALWLALPSITRNGELGRASWTAVLGAIVVALIIAKTKVSLKIVIPVLIAAAIAVRLLRPRQKTRPPR